jgi:hypothetical protein
MSSFSARLEFHDNAPRDYFYMPVVTPPERLVALYYRDHGKIEMESPDVHAMSPPSVSDTEAGEGLAYTPCPSPPASSCDFHCPELVAPSPPESSRDETQASPLSPLQVLSNVPASVAYVDDLAPSPPITQSPLPPAPPPGSLLSSGRRLPALELSPSQAPSPPMSDPDINFPSPSPPGSPEETDCKDSPPRGPPLIYTPPKSRNPVEYYPDVVPDASPISVSSSSPTRSFPWPSIPEAIKHHFALPRGDSVVALAQISYQPRPFCAGPCCQPRLVIADDLLDGEAAVRILRTLPTPGPSGIKRTVEGWIPGKRFTAVEVRHNGITRRFATWAFTVWFRFSQIRDSIAVWGRALKHVETRQDTQTLDLMKSLPWDTVCPFPQVSLDAIGRLGSKQWLNDESIAVLVYMINQELEDPTSLILTSWSSSFIRSAWHTYSNTGLRLTRPWITKLYEDFARGSLTRLGLCVNVIAGGCPSERGNHWIGVVIDACLSTIYIGDSLGNPHDEAVIHMIKWFLAPVFSRDFAVRSLAYSIQPGTWSCGDYSVNMIAHHFNPEKYPLIGDKDKDAVEHRMQLFHAAFNTLRELVCIILNRQVPIVILFTQSGDKFRMSSTDVEGHL